MKAYLIIVLAALLLAVFSSCKKSDIGIEHSTEFNSSVKAWQSFKKSNNNTYQYTVAESSWVGTAWQTEIKVLEGIVIQRHFKYTSTGQSAIPQEELEWTEDEHEINSHQNSAAAKPFTLDQIYEQAHNEWLIKRKDAQVYFEAKNNGLISLSGYVSKACADDCFIGIRITSIL